MGKGLNAQQVLDNLDELGNESRKIDDVFKDLEIFDWWVNTLTTQRQREMRKFLKLAIELGYTGYVCFKVGASGCANGMWAHKKESEDGYSPDGECLYRSFTPDYVHYDFCNEKGEWFGGYGTEYEIKDEGTLRSYMRAVALFRKED